MSARIRSLRLNPTFLVALVTACVALLLAAGGAFLALRGRTALAIAPTVAFGSPPPIAETTPASLEALAARYPRLRDLLLDQSLASVYKELLIAGEDGGGSSARDVARRRGILNDDDQVMITLVVDEAASVEAVAGSARLAGMSVLGTYGDLIDAGVPMAEIERSFAARDPGSAFARLSRIDHVVKLRSPITTQVDAPVELPADAG